MSLETIIAIDGPAGSGKSTVGSLVAGRLGFLYFDTGVLYRALTYAALQSNVPLERGEALTALAEASVFDVQTPTVADGRLSTVIWNGRDCSWEIRSTEVDQAVSTVAKNELVRRALLPAQRRIAERGNVVMIGRDVGTVVAPEAGLKIYLEASLETRALRRSQQISRADEQPDLAAIKEMLENRDYTDITRKTAPLRCAPDAIEVRNEGRTPEETANLIVNLYRDRSAGRDD